MPAYLVTVYAAAEFDVIHPAAEIVCRKYPPPRSSMSGTSLVAERMWDITLTCQERSHVASVVWRFPPSGPPNTAGLLQNRSIGPTSVSTQSMNASSASASATSNCRKG